MTSYISSIGLRQTIIIGADLLFLLLSFICIYMCLSCTIMFMPVSLCMGTGVFMYLYVCVWMCLCIYMYVYIFIYLVVSEWNV